MDETLMTVLSHVWDCIELAFPATKNQFEAEKRFVLHIHRPCKSTTYAVRYMVHDMATWQRKP